MSSVLSSVAASSEARQPADMEVAGQWRREWAGTAEYGKKSRTVKLWLQPRHDSEVVHCGHTPPPKSATIHGRELIASVLPRDTITRVTEGGVTRQVARAMEVLHASAPGARVRVMRAAYHSSAGPGAPSASCLMHSSRRVISSGFNLLEAPSYPSKPLELSSTPLESSPESNIEVENYKVTEPDDFEISEPSKWKSSINGSSIRMSSEESSSTDNASIIDLDSRAGHRSLFRKYSFDSENSDAPTTRKSSSRISPLLDDPIALSTLKYKSLLNSSNEWNTRRKSYSFEDTSPLNETVVHSNDTLAMESSTDSGICKSSELVNGSDEKYNDQIERKYDRQEENFKDWLFKNRASSFYRGNQMKSYRDHNVLLEHPHENNIALQSNGKLSIAVPMTIENDDDFIYKRNHAIDGDRKVKRVEFCKTELHFAAESGKVNIIATDKKPPPSNDFRKRRSAFVPIHSNFEKPVTLFGENNDFPEGNNEFADFTNSEICESDENTASTKSILKNKIAKPKPYLLGENMVFGRSHNNGINNKDDNIFQSTASSTVTLKNIQLQSGRHCDDSITDFSNETCVINSKAFRTINEGPTRDDNLTKKSGIEIETTTTSNHIKESRHTNDAVRNKLKSMPMSPIQARAKTRQLRDSDLTYFGINKSPKVPNEIGHDKVFQSENKGIDDFQSVRLIQQVSNSVCNSETESEPDYQNIPLKNKFAPVPTPRSRTKYEGKQEIRILKPVLEQVSEPTVTLLDSRRSRHRRQDDIMSTPNRSISEPPKINRYSTEKPSRRHHLRTLKEKNSSPTRSSKKYTNENNDFVSPIFDPTNSKNDLLEENDPLYVNFSVQNGKNQSRSPSTDPSRRRSAQEQKSHINTETNTNVREHRIKTMKSHRKPNTDDYKTNKINKERTDSDQDSLLKKHQSLKKKSHIQRTEKLSTPEYSSDQRKIYDKLANSRKTSNEKIEDNNARDRSKQEHRSRSSQRHSVLPKVANEDIKENTNLSQINVSTEKNANNVVQNNNRTKKSSKDKVSERKETPKSDLKLNTNSSNSRHGSMKSGIKETNTVERMPKPDSYKSSKRSEYVINYDDKNGTVSSICKVKVDPGASKRKKSPKDNSIDNPKEHKGKIKTAEKTFLLQLPERLWNTNGLKYTDKKWKKRMHVQRSCQIL